MLRPTEPVDRDLDLDLEFDEPANPSIRHLNLNTLKPPTTTSTHEFLNKWHSTKQNLLKLPNKNVFLLWKTKQDEKPQIQTLKYPAT